MLEGGPVIFHISTQKHVVLSVTAAELYTGGNTVQDILDLINMLLSIGLFIELSVVLKVDNMGAVYLANN